MIKKIIQIFLLFLFCAIILSLSLRGIAGNPTSETVNDPYWKDNGPLELSPDRGRFALTYSVLEDKNVHFSLPIARFATPDLGYINGQYVSLFAPGISYLIMPGYLLGKTLGISQVGAFAIISLFAIINVVLLRSIAIRLGANSLAATIASLIFIFATPAFTYAVTLYQHHISTFLILLSIYTLIRWKTLWSLLLIWFLCAASIPIDYPNLFLMFPIGLYALGRLVIFKKQESKLNISIKFAGFITFIAAVLPLSFFLWFNQISYGNPFQLSGTVPSVKAIDVQGNPTAPALVGTENIQRFINPEKQDKSAIRFFKSRNLLSGLSIHFASLDRGILVYTPVVLFGVLGIFILYKRNQQILSLLLGIIGLNFLLYSMWGDPYGGWAFGSRYLIPSYAILSILIGVTLSSLRKNTLFLLIFFVLASYSIAVNTLGAITTSRIPPKVEAIPLERISGVVEKYTYTRNIDYIKNNRSKSFVFQTYASKYLTAWQYYLILTSIIIAVLSGLLIYHRLERQNVGV